MLNANYLQAPAARTSTRSRTATASACTSSCSQGILRDATGIRTLDIAKRLIDYGFHPPTIYFPLIVPEALMIEPTETESKADARRVRRGAARDRAARREPIPTCCTTRRTARPCAGWTR